MEARWYPLIFLRFLTFLVSILIFGIQRCWSLNVEGLALLAFRKRIISDPLNALKDWNPYDTDPCKWSGVHCVNGHVQILNLGGLSLEGSLTPELGELGHLKSLVLDRNCFSGTVPGEIEALKKKLELLDSTDSIYCYVNRKFARRIREKNSIRPTSSLNDQPRFPRSDIIQNEENLGHFIHRRLLGESNNLPALPFNQTTLSGQIIALPTTRSSGTFPAVPRSQPKAPSPAPKSTLPHSPPSNHNNSSSPTSTDHAQSSTSSGLSLGAKFGIIIASCVVFLLVVFLALLFFFRKKGVTNIGPWKTGISGQLQKAFITGAPKLNRPELERACEDFSNIIDTLDGCTIYKGTLSSGVEIAVAYASISSSKEWSNNAELAYRKKIVTFSQANHKNFVNLLGYCEEEEPFTRMMVFEYAPNGTLYEHLHVKEAEHLDWSARMRIIMGTGYCLQYMHHEINPPVSHSNLNSAAIYLTDDYAAKVAEISFSSTGTSRSVRAESGHSVLPPLADPETNVYSFGLLLLEIISGKPPYSEEQGPLATWASEFLNDKRSISYMIDSSLKSFKNDELDIICEVIQDCIKPDSRMRPTMKEITLKLREVLDISPEQAVPRLSPLWWAELEILSAEVA